MMIYPTIGGVYGFDKKYKIYYDETNNIRRLRTKNLLQDNKLFALGGVAYEESFDIKKLDNLLSELKPQSSIKKIKLKHITQTKKEFFDILALDKITKLLQYLLETENCYIHYIVVDLLYYGVVDIIDSIILNDLDILISFQLKSDLYNTIRDNLKFFQSLFSQYSYPDIKDYRTFFIELKNKVEPNKYRLIKLLDNASKSSKIPILLSNNEPNILVGTFSDFFMFRISLFSNSKHIFDNEPKVEEKLSSQLNNRFHNYCFMPSEEDNNLQISDLIIGLLGKYYTFVNNYKKQWDFYRLQAMPSDKAIDNLNILIKIIHKSEECSNGFIHEIISRDFNKKEYEMWNFLDLEIPNCIC